jgi:hypothetical protein
MGSCQIALLVLCVFPALAPAAAPFVLKDGTPIKVRLDRTLSSSDARVGDTVEFEVVADVVVDGAVVVPSGGRVHGTVTQARPKGLMGKAGKLDVSMDYAHSILGEKIAVRAVQDTARLGGGNSGVVDLATSIVTAPKFLFMKGKDVTIPKGTEVIAYVNRDVALDEARVRAHSRNAPPAAATPVPVVAASPAPAPVPVPTPRVVPPPPKSLPAPARSPVSGMTNGDVLTLKAAGFSDDLIVWKIKSSRTAFRLETGDMIELKKAGLSNRVVAAMLEKTR